MKYKCPGTGNEHDWVTGYACAWTQRCDECGIKRNTLAHTFEVIEAALESSDDNAYVKVAKIAIANFKNSQRDCV